MALLPRSFQFQVDNATKAAKGLFIPDGRGFFARPDGELDPPLKAIFRALKPQKLRVSKKTTAAMAKALVHDYERLTKNRVQRLVKTSNTPVGMEAATLSAAVAYALGAKKGTATTPTPPTGTQPATPCASSTSTCTSSRYALKV